MQCDQAEILLTALIYDELDSKTKSDVVVHLGQCEKCRALLAEFRSASALAAGAVEAHCPKLSIKSRAKLYAKAAAVRNNNPDCEVKHKRRTFSFGDLWQNFRPQLAAALVLIALVSITAAMLSPDFLAGGCRARESALRSSDRYSPPAARESYGYDDFKGEKDSRFEGGIAQSYAGRAVAGLSTSERETFERSSGGLKDSEVPTDGLRGPVGTPLTADDVDDDGWDIGGMGVYGEWGAQAEEEEEPLETIVLADRMPQKEGLLRENTPQSVVARPMYRTVPPVAAEPPVQDELGAVGRRRSPIIFAGEAEEAKMAPRESSRSGESLMAPSGRAEASTRAPEETQLSKVGSVAPAFFRMSKDEYKAERERPQWKRELDEKMQQKLTFNFNRIPLEDVLRFLQAMTDVNIHITPLAIEMERDTEVSLKVTDIPFETALRWILDEIGLVYKVEDERIIITPPDANQEKEQEEEPVRTDERSVGSELPPSSYFRSVPVNPWVRTQNDRFSTFALNVDTASYAIARSYLRRGFLPPPASVRMEEFVNAFDYNYPTHTAGVFEVNAAGMPSPFRNNLVLLKIGVQGRALGREGRKPMHVVFVVDTSGSMGRRDRMPLVQQGIAQFAERLQDGDRVSLVTFGGDTSLVLEAVPASQREKIIETVEAIRCSGWTNLLDGVRLGYEVAGRHFRAGDVNTIVLCSDGIANVGMTATEEILAQVAEYRRQGIGFTSVGVGVGSFNDELLERLATRGDGPYFYIDSHEQAQHVFVDQLATVQPIALDARIQVEFDPARVYRHRLIGYEQREIAHEDFRRDHIKAGYVGSGQSSTAIYELELHPVPEQISRQAPLGIGTVYVRYRNYDTGRMEEISRRIDSTMIRRREVEEATRLYLATAVAEFAEILRESPQVSGSGLQNVAALVDSVRRLLPRDQKVSELAELISASMRAAKAP